MTRSHYTARVGFLLQAGGEPVRLATCSQDGTIKLWSPDSGRLLATLEGHTDQVLACNTVGRSG